MKKIIILSVLSFVLSLLLPKLKSLVVKLGLIPPHRLMLWMFLEAQHRSAIAPIILIDLNCTMQIPGFAVQTGLYFINPMARDILIFNAKPSMKTPMLRQKKTLAR